MHGVFSEMVMLESGTVQFGIKGLSRA